MPENFNKNLEQEGALRTSLPPPPPPPPPPKKKKKADLDSLSKFTY